MPVGKQQRGRDPMTVWRVDVIDRDVRAHERALRRLQWNPVIARKIQVIGRRIITRRAAEGDQRTRLMSQTSSEKTSVLASGM